MSLEEWYIEGRWKRGGKNDLEGKKEMFKCLEEYVDWFGNVKKS